MRLVEDKWTSQADISHQEAGYKHSAQPGLWWDPSLQVSIGIGILITRSCPCQGERQGSTLQDQLWAALHHLYWRQTRREQRGQEQAFKWAIATHSDTNKTA